MRAPAVAKGFLGSSLTVHVEGVWIGEDFLVPVGGLVRRDDTLACFDELQGGAERLARSKNGTNRERTLPPRVMSTLATRRAAIAEAVWNLQSSSTKTFARDGSALRSLSWSGCCRRVTMP